MHCFLLDCTKSIYLMKSSYLSGRTIYSNLSAEGGAWFLRWHVIAFSYFHFLILEWYWSFETGIHISLSFSITSWILFLLCQYYCILLSLVHFSPPILYSVWLTVVLIFALSFSTCPPDLSFFSIILCMPYILLLRYCCLLR